MTTKTLYIYESVNPATGKKRTRKTLTQNPSYGTLIGTAYRLTAAPHKVLVNALGDVVYCIDTDEPARWTEEDEPQPEPEPENDETSEN